MKLRRDSRVARNADVRSTRATLMPIDPRAIPSARRVGAQRGQPRHRQIGQPGAEHRQQRDGHPAPGLVGEHVGDPTGRTRRPPLTAADTAKPSVSATWVRVAGVSGVEKQPHVARGPPRGPCQRHEPGEPEVGRGDEPGGRPAPAKRGRWQSEGGLGGRPDPHDGSAGAEGHRHHAAHGPGRVVGAGHLGRARRHQQEAGGQVGADQFHRASLRVGAATGSTAQAAQQRVDPGHEHRAPGLAAQHDVEGERPARTR